MIGCWGSHLGDVWAFASYCIQNELNPISSIAADGKPIVNKLTEIIPLLCSKGTTWVDEPPTEIIDQWNVWKHEYLPTKKLWNPDSCGGPVVHQLTGGRLHGDLKNLPDGDAKRIIESVGSETIELGAHFSLRECVEAMAAATVFIGIDSGMSHIAHSVGVPMIIVKNQFDLEPYHESKTYALADGADQAIEILHDIIS